MRILSLTLIGACILFMATLAFVGPLPLKIMAGCTIIILAIEYKKQWKKLKEEKNK